MPRREKERQREPQRDRISSTRRTCGHSLLTEADLDALLKVIRYGTIPVKAPSHLLRSFTPALMLRNFHTTSAGPEKHMPVACQVSFAVAVDACRWSKRTSAITQSRTCRSKEVKAAIIHFPFSPDLSFGQFTEPPCIWSCSSVALQGAPILQERLELNSMHSRHGGRRRGKGKHKASLRRKKKGMKVSRQPSAVRSSLQHPAAFSTKYPALERKALKINDTCRSSTTAPGSQAFGKSTKTARYAVRHGCHRAADATACDFAAAVLSLAE